MARKTKLLALAMIGAAWFVLPAVASAGESQIHCVGGASCGKLTVSGQATLSVKGGLTVTCGSVTGTGEGLTKTTGTIQLKLHECKENIFGTSCNGIGQPAGTVTFGLSTYHSIYTTDSKTAPGILMTPPSGGVYANFSCAGGLSNHEVKGNGVIGSITTPACGGTSSFLTLSFQAGSHGFQDVTRNTATGTSFSLTDNGESAALKADLSVSYTTAATLTCI